MSLRSSAIRPQALLPNQPSPALAAAQAPLTQRYLQPHLGSFARYLSELRAQLDPGLRQSRPLKLGKPYPIGQCLEICHAMQAQWRQPPLAALSQPASQGRAALLAFCKAGGSVRQVWGDLRGRYFQNAFQVGGLYVDVANDTVDPAKPPIEILPFAEAGLTAIDDFHHYAAVGRRYWQGDFYPNHIVPSLAPYFPWVHINRLNQVALCDLSDYMLALTSARQFRASEAVLVGDPMPEALFALLQRALVGCGVPVASHLEAGRTAALAACREYRAKRWYLAPKQCQWAVAQRARVHTALRRAAYPTAAS